MKLKLFSDDVIEKCSISYDTVATCKYEVPSYRDIGAD
jgi:hypothetical protein